MGLIKQGILYSYSHEESKYSTWGILVGGRDQEWDETDITWGDAGEKVDMRRLNNIANIYNKTTGTMKEIWKKKWYELVKIISTKLKRTIH